MKRVRAMFLILPTAELLREPRSSRALLEKIELTPEILAEAVLIEWARVEGEWGNGYNPFDVSTYELVTSTLINDYLHCQEFLSLTKEEQMDLINAIRGFCRTFFDTIIELLDELNMTQYQLQTLRLHKWLHHSMVIDILV